MTTTNNLTNNESSDVVDFTKMWKTIWAGKLQIVMITTLFAVVSIVSVLLMADRYRSVVLLAPVDDSEGGIGNMLKNLGGLASIAGINIGKKKLTKESLALEILKSRSFIKTFIEKHGILVQMMATEGWDSDNNQLIYDPDLYDTENNKWVRNVSHPKKTIPAPQEAHGFFLDLLNISKDKDSGLITVSITYYSPVIAKQWVDWLVTDINEHMKSLDKADAQDSIDYLEKEMASTSLTKMHNIFYQLIEEQTKIIMLANVRSEYVFKTIDPAVVKDEKHSPRRAVIVVLITLLGGLLGVASVLLRNRAST